ncbi:MAG: metal-dependent transcriptional regulator [Eubacteriales bacterium]|nr:metal-dependent transcriptional regulator [Eubacteriales bacterium]
MNIHESAEDYLEAILMLHQQKGYARSVDIAAKLNVTKPSVSIAMKRLRENGYILMDEENLITLTPQGEAIARRILERHCTLAAMLTALGVDEKTALEDACKIEHDISEKSFEAICRHARERASEN